MNELHKPKRQKLMTFQKSHTLLLLVPANWSDWFENHSEKLHMLCWPLEHALIRLYPWKFLTYQEKEATEIKFWMPPPKEFLVLRDSGTSASIGTAHFKISRRTEGCGDKAKYILTTLCSLPEGRFLTNSAVSFSLSKRSTVQIRQDQHFIFILMQICKESIEWKTSCTHVSLCVGVCPWNKPRRQILDSLHFRKHSLF